MMYATVRIDPADLEKLRRGEAVSRQFPARGLAIQVNVVLGSAAGGRGANEA